MSVLVYISSSDGVLKKVNLEVISYAKSLADRINKPLCAVSFSDVSDKTSKYGVSKFYKINSSEENPSIKSCAKALKEVYEKENASVVVFDSGTKSKSIAPYFSGLTSVGYVSGVISLPKDNSSFIVKRNCFGNKAISSVEINSEKKIIGLVTNIFEIKEANSEQEIIELNFNTVDKSFKVINKEPNTEKISIEDAQVVVSGGRGLKGPENWYLIEELAQTLNAAIACSKPVSDMGWRPHSEHVGQTGKPVASHIYIAAGISGSIQHLAGIAASKIKIIINTDFEAPFFKAADYGVIGDALKILPELTKKLKSF